MRCNLVDYAFVTFLSVGVIAFLFALTLLFFVAKSWLASMEHRS